MDKSPRLNAVKFQQESQAAFQYIIRPAGAKAHGTQIRCTGAPATASAAEERAQQGNKLHGPGRVILLQHLAQPERHVAKGKRHIASQEAMVAELELDGRDTSDARKILAALSDVQTLYEQDVEDVMRALGSKTASGSLGANDISGTDDPASSPAIANRSSRGMITSSLLPPAIGPIPRL